MNTLQDALDKLIAEIPARFLEKAIAKKLREQGISEPKSLSAKLAKHVLQGNSRPLKVRTKKHSGEISLSFTENDLDELMKEIDSFFKTKLPKLIDDVAPKAAKDLLRALESRWPSENTAQLADITGFRTRLEDRWGKPLGQLRMLLTMAREWGQAVHAKDAAQQPRINPNLREILLRLHVRGCQVTDEIICLLENGLADGAMARWRTLHEIAVVAAVIFRHGEDIAIRYVAHQEVESKRAMNKYVNCCQLLGYKPLSKKQIEKITKRYEKAKQKYGKEFDEDYGWASHHLKKKGRISFADLEVEAGRQDMRSHYQMGNDNIHAGIKSMFIRLGLIDHHGYLAGRSNFGLMEPGQLAAYTLTQLSVLVCLNQPKLDDLVIAEMMRKLRQAIPQSFYHVDKRLRRDDKHYRALAAEDIDRSILGHR
jgi:hypothetical protein